MAGKDSSYKISLNDGMLKSSAEAQEAIINSKTIHLPHRDDILSIMTDGAIRHPGISATLYISRGVQLLLAGFFSGKLRGHQVAWIPCEIEALSIAVTVRHFSAYIIQYIHNSVIQTCVHFDR